mgnify:CR=1 FL=1
MNASQPHKAAVIDCHQHFWSLSRGDYHWITPDLIPLDRDFGPADLAPLLQDNAVGRTIAVQAAATIDETRFLLSLADNNDFIAGVVGWVDMESPRAASDIAQLAANPKFKGIRPMARDYRGPEWLCDPAIVPAIESLARHGLRFEALVTVEHLESLRAMMSQYPDLRVVINHAAKPDVRAGWSRAWGDRIADIAANTSAYCKFSGLVTETDTPNSVDSLSPIFDHLLECFGAKRLMWGSDWPVLNLACTYDEWLSTTMTLIQQLNVEDRSRILGRNAVDFYALPTAEPKVLA